MLMLKCGNVCMLSVLMMCLVDIHVATKYTAVTGYHSRLIFVPNQQQTLCKVGYRCRQVWPDSYRCVWTVAGVSRQSQVWPDNRRCDQTIAGVARQSQVWPDNCRCGQTITGVARQLQVWPDNCRCAQTITGVLRQLQVWLAF